MHQYPSARGLYQPHHEHDACGVGFIADLEGRASHRLLEQSIHAVIRLAHRGAIWADGLTGDGAGVATQLPLRLLREEGWEWGADDALGIGVFFLSQDEATRKRCEAIVETVLAEQSLEIIGWRDVPTSPEVLGDSARATCPVVRQLLIQRPEGISDNDFERCLYAARRITQFRVLAAGVDRFSIPSFSHRTIVYKGLMVSPQLDRFYQDLANPAYETAVSVFHQRYSTNTHPTWALAQPLRRLSHNGEINTLRGNVNWIRAREAQMHPKGWDVSREALFPLVDPTGSDAAMVDNVFELLVLAGRDPLHALSMMVPEAYKQRPETSPELRAYYTYHAALMEPWDGPAALIYTDGRLVAATLDRNGLRPLRYWITDDGLMIAGSEVGLVDVPAQKILERGRLGPGQMIAVNLNDGKILRDREIKATLAARRPYGEWIDEHLLRAPLPAASSLALTEAQASTLEIVTQQKIFGYGTEEVNLILAPMLYDAKGAIGSMGDDTPLAILSRKPQLLYRYFKQRFAQVTNPPIDPLRERLVMSLTTLIGRAHCQLLDERPEATRLIEFSSPVLSTTEFEWLKNCDHDAAICATLDATFDVAEGGESLQDAVTRLHADADAAIRGGATILILSDRAVSETRAPVPMLLATASIHHQLIRVGERMLASIVCDTGEVREDHHFACLIGYGASLVHPYLAYESVADVARRDPERRAISPEAALANFKSAVEKGLLKILSKMGISTISSYRGAQIFEAIGLDDALVDQHFLGTDTRIGGATIETLEGDARRFHAEAIDELRLRERGTYRYRKHGEHHAYHPLAFKALHKAVRERDWASYLRYAKLNDEHPPCNLRDLLDWEKAATPVPLDEVESAESIALRFTTQAMSHGALSSESHEVLAVAMNRLGGKSNSGEGGEDPERHRRYNKDMTARSHAPWHPQAGDDGNSAIKQIASGRFGVTPEYLASASQLEIKMAQGSKPGEGGHIPGHKVTEEIARIRRSIPGVPLISPPPHHDIYSIEDLAQLIYDLKRINTRAEIGVKLVSVAGVGTIAAGVAKGRADYIQISGSDGGTGASPLASIKHAGVPWELGLAEIQQVLVQNDLRGHVLLRVDGGMRTGRDVVIAALLGAESFGFGTTALIASGCVMARRCHTNSCPVGIATQRPELRARFPGKPEEVIACMLYIAEQVRMILAEIGARSLDEVIGRVELLNAVRLDAGKAPLSLDAILTNPDPSGERARRRMFARNVSPETGTPLDEVVWRDCEASVESGAPIERQYDIVNRDRTVGARVSGEIALRGGPVVPDGTFDLRFNGIAGQSFGAFCNHGMRLTLLGEAQDYVGKGMHGGEIIVRHPEAASGSVLVGNTVMYGATGGTLHVAGRAGERLCVRNSGSLVVVEGCGDHGCEYMTGGVAVVLGETGLNFGAGMSGGIAFVFDGDDVFEQRYNSEMICVERLDADGASAALLRELVERHYAQTQSTRARELLDAWSTQLAKFWKITPDPGLEDPIDRRQSIDRLVDATLSRLQAQDLSASRHAKSRV